MSSPLTTPPDGPKAKPFDINAPNDDLEANPLIEREELRKNAFTHAGKGRHVAADLTMGLANMASLPAQLAGAIVGVPLGWLAGKLFGKSNDPSAALEGAAKGNRIFTALASIPVLPLTLISLALGCATQALRKKTMKDAFATANGFTVKWSKDLEEKAKSQKYEAMKPNDIEFDGGQINSDKEELVTDEDKRVFLEENKKSVLTITVTGTFVDPTFNVKYEGYRISGEKHIGIFSVQAQEGDRQDIEKGIAVPLSDIKKIEILNKMDT